VAQGETVACALGDGVGVALALGVGEVLELGSGVGVVGATPATPGGELEEGCVVGVGEA
jgi:hypothetical protein